MKSAVTLSLTAMVVLTGIVVVMCASSICTKPLYRPPSSGSATPRLMSKMYTSRPARTMTRIRLTTNEETVAKVLIASQKLKYFRCAGSALSDTGTMAFDAAGVDISGLTGGGLTVSVLTFGGLPSFSSIFSMSCLNRAPLEFEDFSAIVVLLHFGICGDDSIPSRKRQTSRIRDVVVFRLPDQKAGRQCLATFCRQSVFQGFRWQPRCPLLLRLPQARATQSDIHSQCRLCPLPA